MCVCVKIFFFFNQARLYFELDWVRLSWWLVFLWEAWPNLNEWASKLIPKYENFYLFKIQTHQWWLGAAHELGHGQALSEGLRVGKQVGAILFAKLFVNTIFPMHLDLQKMSLTLWTFEIQHILLTKKQPKKKIQYITYLIFDSTTFKKRK